MRDWPENNGAMSGTTVNTTLKAGDVVDRIGYTTGNFLAPVGTSLSGRALAPGSFADPYNQYVVLKPFVVEESEVAPAFGELGQEVQFKIPDAQPGQKVTVQDLIDKGYLGLK